MGTKRYNRIKDSKFIKAKEIIKSVSKEQTLNGFDKCVCDIKNTPSTKNKKDLEALIIKSTLLQIIKLLCVILIKKIKKLQIKMG